MDARSDPELYAELERKFHDRMPPAVWDAFITHAGTIEGWEDLDVVKACEVPDDAD